MKISNQGQVLPFCLLVIIVILWILFSNFEIGFQQMKKVKAQKELDGLAMNYATQYARGLNALAALNQGLAIASERAIMVATVYASLAACSWWILSPCTPHFTRLGLRLPEFYNNLNKLGKDLEKQQNDIMDWMVQVRCRTSKLKIAKLEYFSLYPDFGCSNRSKLPFFRPNSDQLFKDLSGNVGVIFGIPAPLQLKNEFLSEKNKVLMLTSDSIGSILRKEFDNYPGELPKKNWILSEIKIEGSDFQKMEFEPFLHQISMQEQLWKNLSAMNKMAAPRLQELKDDIHH